MITYTDIVKNSEFRKHILGSLGIALVVTLQFQTLPLDIGIQMLPITTILVAAAFPFLLTRIPTSPMLGIVMLFAGYAILHSVIILLIDLFSGESLFRFGMWLRQIISFLLGIMTYLVFRATLFNVKTGWFAKAVLYSALPAVIVGALNMIWGAFDLSWAGSIVEAVRLIAAPYHYYSPYRATGFSTEPLSFAVTLVTLVLPCLMIIYVKRINRVLWYTVVLLSILSFLWTFSTVGIIILLVVLSAGVVFGPAKRHFTAAMLLTLPLIAVVLLLVPSNQVLRHATVVSAGKENVSFDDKIFSAIGPFMRMYDSRTFIGYGLGGVTTHFSEVVPKKVEAGMRAVKYRGMPSLVSAFGRTFAETGIVGFLLFISIFAIGYWEIQVLIRNVQSEERQFEYKVFRLAHIAICACIFISIGPYFSPLLWLWLAMIDTRYSQFLRDES